MTRGSWPPGMWWLVHRDRCSHTARRNGQKGCTKTLLPTRFYDGIVERILRCQPRSAFPDAGHQSTERRSQSISEMLGTRLTRGCRLDEARARQYLVRNPLVSVRSGQRGCGRARIAPHAHGAPVAEVYREGLCKSEPAGCSASVGQARVAGRCCTCGLFFRTAHVFFCVELIDGKKRSA